MTTLADIANLENGGAANAADMGNKQGALAALQGQQQSLAGLLSGKYRHLLRAFQGALPGAAAAGRPVLARGVASPAGLGMGQFGQIASLEDLLHGLRRAFAVRESGVRLAPDGRLARSREAVARNIREEKILERGSRHRNLTILAECGYYSRSSHAFPDFCLA